MSVFVVAAPTDLTGVIRETERSFTADGDALVALSPTHHLTVTSDGALRLEGPQSVRFSLRSVRRDGDSCDTSLLSRTSRRRALELSRRCEVLERWTNLDEGLEHELLIAKAPAGRGPLRVRLDVDAPWHHADARGHFFAGPGGEALGVRYGTASLLTRGGARVPLEVSHVAGGLELVVPAALVDAPGAFPLHIDPLVTGSEVRLEDLINVTPTSVSTDESEPALASNTGTQPVLALVVWVDRRRVINADLFGAIVGTSGVISSFPIVVGPNDQRHPAVVWSTTAQGWVVAWDQSTPNGAEIGLAHVTTSGLVTPWRGATSARAPSLGIDSDGAVALAMSLNDTPVIATWDATGPLAEQFRAMPLPAQVTATRTALAVQGGGFALAVETSNTSTLEQHVLFYRPGVSTSPLSLAGVRATQQRAPAVAFGAVVGELWFAWEEPDVGTVVLWHEVPLSVPMLTTLPARRNPTFAMAGMELRLGTLGPLSPASQTTDFFFEDPRQAGGLVPNTVATEVAADQFVMAPFSDALVGVWIAGRVNRDVRGSFIDVSLINTTLKLIPPTRDLAVSRPNQRTPRVALLGEQGLALWVQSGLLVRGSRFTLGPTNVVQLETPRLVLTSATRLDDLDVALEPTGTALVTWTTGAEGVPSVALLGSGTLGVTRPVLMPVSTPHTTTLPVGAWDGTKFVLAWLSGNTMVWAHVDVSSMTIDAPQSVNAGMAPSGLRVSCLEARCRAVWESGQRIFVKRLEDSSGAAEVGQGVRPMVTNDGANHFVAFATSQGFLAGPLDGSGSTMTSSAIVPFGAELPSSAALTNGALVFSNNADQPHVTLVTEVQTLELLDGGFDVGVAMSGGRGVVVAQRWMPDSFSLVAYAQGFALPGVVSVDGGVDAGVDAGVSDGGLGADAGMNVTFDSRSCVGCSASTPLAVVLAALVLLRRRRA